MRCRVQLLRCFESENVESSSGGGQRERATPRERGARWDLQFLLPPLLFLVLLVFPLVHPSLSVPFKTDSHYYNCLRYPSVICACGWFRRLTAGGGVGARGAGP